MPSQEHEQVVAMFRARPPASGSATLAENRAGFELISRLFPVPPDVRCEPVQAGSARAEWVRTPESRDGRTLLYLHGGGYVLGSLNTHREFVARLARSLGAHALNVDYRLAPEHPFPAAVEDATAAYRWLLARGSDPASLVIAGDSAGGGLTLAALLALRDAGEPLPAAAVCFSPWADLEGTGDSAKPGAVDDPLITNPADILGMASLYAGGDLRAPLASPLYGDYAGLPPLLLLAGTREVLRDDAVRIAARARAAGVDTQLEVWEDLIHVWPFFGPNMPEARDALALVAAFVQKRLR